MVLAALWAVLLFLSVWEVVAGQDGCCFGRTRAVHGDTVLTLPSCCVSFVCNDGDIIQTNYGQPGPGGCNEGCEFNGKMYDNGTKVPALCAPLTCVDGSWKVTGGIESCCEHCYLFNTAHVFTFDNNYYSWDGPCNYSVVQTGMTHHPEVGVFTSFRPCFTARFCLYHTTFRNDPYTIISLRHVPGYAIFNIYVNGQQYTVPPTTVQEVRSGPNTHPVLAWRDGQCLFLLGSSGLMVQHCPHRLDVWTYPTHTNNLHGLCGHFNFNPSDDMTARDGTIHPVNPYPLAFPESWRTAVQSSRLCMGHCSYCRDPTTSNPCVASTAEKRAYHVRCSQLLNSVLGPDTELKHHVDACELDLCMLDQAEVSEVEQFRWLTEVVKVTQNSKIHLAMASGYFVPDPLFPLLEGFCVAGSSWKQDCNGCGCSDDTAVPICTRRACPEDFVPEFGDEFCTNGSRWRLDECNSCVCINKGIVCSFNECSGTGLTRPTTISPQTITSASTIPPFVLIPCSLPSRPGSCGSQLLRWYYDFGSGRCLPFYYTGCGGNQNNHETKEECLAECGHFTTSRTVAPVTPLPLMCYMRWDAGSCREAHLKYYFAQETGTCIPAYYTGCGGNDNRFDTLEECLLICGGIGVTTTDASTTSLNCPPIFLACPQDCPIKFIIEPNSNCPKCVCDFPTDPTPTTTPIACPPEFMVCPTYCPVVMVSDTVTGCTMCVCNLPTAA